MTEPLTREQIIAIYERGCGDIPVEIIETDGALRARIEKLEKIVSMPVSEEFEQLCTQLVQVTAERENDRIDFAQQFQLQTQQLAQMTAERDEANRKILQLEQELTFDDLPWTAGFKVKMDKNGNGQLSKQDVHILYRIARNRHKKMKRQQLQLAEAQAECKKWKLAFEVQRALMNLNSGRMLMIYGAS
jgi:hypothetical protein